MIRRIASRVSGAHVLSVIAVAAALGGGYAVATIGGKGSVLFAGEKGIAPGLDPHKLLSVPGMGKLLVKCTTEATDVYFRNTSGHTLYLTLFDQQLPAQIESYALIDGQFSVGSSFGSAPVDTKRYELFRATESGRPNVGITVLHKDGNGTCQDEAVSVRAVTSQ